MKWTRHQDGEITKWRESTFDYVELQDYGIRDGRGDFAITATRYRQKSVRERFSGSLEEVKARGLELLASIPKT